MVRCGHPWGGNGGYLQIGFFVTLAWFRWDAQEYWIEVHCCNYCIVRLRLPVREKVHG
jgi:hypothetical protein